ncbi:hypothetical protein BC830DRAFT_1076319 [Chytriomyces sp. MP71]|nr:hypothetical protein BC830DRAFT_1076319 [Chytriomyces sp. MP71]
MAISDWLPGLHGTHVLVLGTVTGMVLHTTFVASVLQFKTLPKQTFAALQAVQFPPYFAISAAATLYLTYSTYALSSFSQTESPFDALFKTVGVSTSAKRADAVALAVIASAATATLANWLLVGPATAKLGRERALFEKNGQDPPIEVKRRFGAMHGVSSLLNLGVALALVSHCFWVGKRWGTR